MSSTADTSTNLVHPAVVAIESQRVLAIVRSSTTAAAVEAGRALFAAGFLAVEVSLVTPDAVSAIETLAAERPEGAHLGAGTVLDASMASAAYGAGASFLVAPNYVPDVLDEGHRRGMAVIPGAGTVTEMVAAQDRGADLVKIFPASAWTPAALADVRAALPALRTVPTGGVTLASAPQWVRAGATAVGMGSALTRGSAVEIEERATRLLADLRDAGGSAT